MIPADITAAAAILDGIKAPAGVVLPPKEIKAILETTAGYVARNGMIFEDRIREKEKHNPKFSFLSTNDAYNAYYLWRLSEIRDGRGNAIAAGRGTEAALEAETSKGPPEPAEFQFSARMPNISAQDLEVVRLTALFVAKNGRKFRTTLAQRESGNYQFDFLRPQHSLHNFFQRLVDQYTAILRASGEGGKLRKERIRELEVNVKDRFHILARAKERAEWFKYQDQQKQKKEEDVEKENISYAQIDWHDFVVVETVVFTEDDDQAILPAPNSLSELQFASLDQKAMMSIHTQNMRIEEAMPGEETYYNAYQPEVSPMVLSPEPVTQPSPAATTPRLTEEEEEEEEQRTRERIEAYALAQKAQATAKGGAAPMKIKENYVPRAQARQKRPQMALCPNCKQQISYNELDEHMRIELLDPRWKEQKAKADSRYAATNLSTNQVANNLKRLASQRGDLFNGTGQPITAEEADRMKKAASSHDDHAESEAQKLAQLNSKMNVEEQIARIKEKYGGQI